MRLLGGITRVAFVLSALILMALPTNATTLIRQGMEGLATGTQEIVVGRVVDLHSYWNADHTFILTDVRVATSQVLKGDRSRGEIVFTEMGGSVGDVTTLIVGGPELIPGSDYLLFLSRRDLPGVRQALTTGELTQGVFDIVDTPRGRRAVSQATRLGLLPDAAGLDQPPGGDEGLPLEDVAQQIRHFHGER